MRDQMILLITSGDGPAECRQAVACIVDLIRVEAENKTLDVNQIVEPAVHGPKSVVMQFHGEGARSFCEQWLGTIQWTCKSNLRAGHKRQNWFVGVLEMPIRREAKPIDEQNVRFETFRAGGPGGQHQNTTNSAVRAVCTVTGFSAVARDGRSQHRNKALAIERLRALRSAQDVVDHSKQNEAQNKLHFHLVRGNPVRTFTGPKFKEVPKK